MSSEKKQIVEDEALEGVNGGCWNPMVVKCPYCGSKNVRAEGQSGASIIYVCEDCKKSFHG